MLVTVYLFLDEIKIPVRSGFSKSISVRLVLIVENKYDCFLLAVEKKIYITVTR